MKDPGSSHYCNHDESGYATVADDDGKAWSEDEWKPGDLPFADHINLWEWR